MTPTWSNPEEEGPMLEFSSTTHDDGTTLAVWKDGSIMLHPAGLADDAEPVELPPGSAQAVLSAYAYAQRWDV